MFRALLPNLNSHRSAPCVGPRLRARMPHMKLERSRLREPEQRWQVVAQQVLVALVLVPREHRNRASKRWLLLLPVFLKEALTVNAVRHPDHRQRPVRQMRQDERRHLREVAQQVALGDRRLR